MTTPSAEIKPGKPEQGPFISLDDVTLPAAGAFTDQDYTTIPAKSRRLSVVATYTKDAGGTNGQATFQFQWRVPGGNGPIEDVSEVVIDGTDITKVDPVLRNPEYAYQVDGLVVAGASPMNYRVISLEVPILADAFRVIAAEIGDAAHPGKVTVRLYTSENV